MSKTLTLIATERIKLTAPPRSGLAVYRAKYAPQIAGQVQATVGNIDGDTVAWVEGGGQDTALGDSIRDGGHPVQADVREWFWSADLDDLENLVRRG